MNKPAQTNPVFNEVLQRIQHARQKIFTQANTALIDLYWQIGLTISHKVQSEAWGKGVVTELAQYIAHNAPDIKGFSDKNLWRMKQFYETYQTDEKLATLWRELSWSHNRLIMTLKIREERAFYLHLAVQERLSVRELERQIDTAYFERSLMSAKLSPLAREIHPNIQQTFKDQYVLEFLGLPETHSENDLQTALIRHMKAFILELGGIPHPASPLSGGGVNRNQFPPLTRGGVKTMTDKIFNRPENTTRRQDLRNNATQPEQKLWAALRGKQLDVKFRRQHGIGHYIVDFYSPEAKLVIEVDGDSHYTETAQQQDTQRDAYLQSVGLRVVRFTNQDINQNMAGVFETIKRVVDDR